MTDQPDLLTQFSNALAARAEAAKNAVVAIRLAHGRHMTGMVWRSGIVVASEQSLPRNDDFELVAAGGSVLTARIAGRDPSCVAIDRGGRGAYRRSCACDRSRRNRWRERAAGARQSRRRRMAFQPRRPDRPAHRVRSSSCPPRGGRPRLRRRRRLSGHVDLRATRPGHCDSDRNDRTYRTAAPQGRPHRARVAWGCFASRRRARCAARERRPVQRLDGHVGRRRRPRGASRNCGGRHHPECRRSIGASVPKNRWIFRFRQHRAKGGSSPYQERQGDYGADDDRGTSRA